MLLPGGYSAPGGLRREATYKSLTGEIELALVRDSLTAVSIPARVTAVGVGQIEWPDANGLVEILDRAPGVAQAPAPSATRLANTVTPQPAARS